MSTPPVDGPNDTNNTRLGNANSDPSTEATDAERYRFTESPEGLSDKVEKSEEEESEEEEDGEEEDGEEEEEEEGDEDGDTADDDEVSGSGESDSDSEDEDEEEPALKYARIDGAVPEVLKKDSASALAVSGNRLLALGTHAGIVHILDLSGKRLKSYKPHLASIVDIEFDETGDFVATASIDGQIYVRSLSTNEFYTFNLKRPMRTIALEPHFANRRSTRAFVAGGLAGNLIMYDKGWLGHRETIISSGEGPIWQVRWVDGTTTGSGGFIAWANDMGVKIYHPTSKTLLIYIDRPPNSPRAELFKPTLQWQDESTLLVAWADYLKVARIRARPPSAEANPAVSLAPYTVEITAVFQMDACVVAGIIPHPLPQPSSSHSDSPHKHFHNGHVHHHSGGTPRLEADEDAKSTHSKAASLHSTGSKPSSSRKAIASSPPLTTFLLLTYIPPPSLLIDSTEDAPPSEEDHAKQKRPTAERPELRIVSRTTGEELANDVLGVRDYEKWGCNEYALALVPGSEDVVAHTKSTSSASTSAGAGGVEDEIKERCYVVMSPRDLIVVKKRDRKDRIRWLVERGRWEEALKEVEDLERVQALTGVPTQPTQEKGDEKGEVPDEKANGNASVPDADLTVQAIGQKYIRHLLQEEDFTKAASLLPKVCGRGKSKAIGQRWEEWMWEFAGRGQLQAVIPYVPVDAPRLDHTVYEMVLGHFLGHDLRMLLETVKTWPREIYDVGAVVVAVKARLEKVENGVDRGEKTGQVSRQEEVVLLMECLAELYTANRQPGKALPYYLRLRRPNVFELIRDNNLFTDVQDQVLLLVEFDHELMERRRKESEEKDAKTAPSTVGQKTESEAIKLLVDNIHSISINRVVSQLQKRPYYLFLYLDSLAERDPQLVSEFADLQVKMYAEFASSRLIDFLRASNYYSLEQAYNVCKERDLVPEMVFLLGRMGNNKQALTLIIERLGDVHRAIDFAKSQNDDDLWEDLLRYSETRPAFIRGLLENVGVEISPVRLIRRIKNGLEIPGLKEALIKILQDFQLQIELMEGCKKVLDGDCAELAEGLGKKQEGGFRLSATTKCPVCLKPLQQHPHDAPRSSTAAPASSLTLLFLCRHVVHASCANGGNHLPLQTDPILRGLGYGSDSARGISGTIAFESMIKPRLRQGCPVCFTAANGVGSVSEATSPVPQRVGFARPR